MEPDLERYSRQIYFDRIGEAGQRRLLASRVVVMGCGALGTVSASSLARAGVGRLLLVDRDFIEENNLQRQILFDEEDIKKGLPKAEAARIKLQRVNSRIQIEARVADINHTDIEDLVRDADLVVDGTDNFETRFLINDACVKAGIPWIYGACIGSIGLTMNIRPGLTPCLRCVFESAPPPEMSPSCDTAGVLSSIVNLVASLQVTEALKLLVRREDELRRDLLHIDVWTGAFQALRIGDHPHPDCPTCGRRQFEFLAATSGSDTTSLCGRNSVQVTPKQAHAVDFALLENKVKKLGPVKSNKFMLKFEVPGYQFTVFPDGRAIIQGTHDPTVARKLYAKYVGH
jgi:molybdopterin/thiamine biosynthesis adenylyltransferase